MTPTVAESYTLPRFIERRHVGWQERRRQYLRHIELVRAARADLLALPGGIPPWKPGPGLRTVRRTP